MPISFPTNLNDGTYFEVFDDFVYAASATASDVQTWTAMTDGSTGTPAYQSGTGSASGWFNTVTAASANDYSGYRSPNKIFKFAAGKPLWFDAKFTLTEATVLESTWWFGVSDTVTTGGMQSGTGGPLASFVGALIYKTPETALTVNARVSNAAVQSTSAAFGTSISGAALRCQFYFDGVSLITPHFFNGTSWAQGSALQISLTATTEMYPIWGVKAGPTAAAETLQMDFIRCMQTR